MPHPELHLSSCPGSSLMPHMGCPSPHQEPAQRSAVTPFRPTLDPRETELWGASPFLPQADGPKMHFIRNPGQPWGPGHPGCLNGELRNAHLYWFSFLSCFPLPSPHPSLFPLQLCSQTNYSYLSLYFSLLSGSPDQTSVMGRIMSLTPPRRISRLKS